MVANAQAFLTVGNVELAAGGSNCLGFRRAQFEGSQEPAPFLQSVRLRLWSERDESRASDAVSFD